MRLLAPLLLVLGLGGCAAFAGDPKPVAKLVVSGDTFCRQMTYVDPATGAKTFALSWDTMDSAATVQEIMNMEAKWKAVCEKKKAVALAPIK